MMEGNAEIPWFRQRRKMSKTGRRRSSAISEIRHTAGHSLGPACTAFFVHPGPCWNQPVTQKKERKRNSSNDTKYRFPTERIRKPGTERYAQNQGGKIGRQNRAHRPPSIFVREKVRGVRDAVQAKHARSHARDNPVRRAA